MIASKPTSEIEGDVASQETRIGSNADMMSVSRTRMAVLMLLLLLSGVLSTGGFISSLQKKEQLDSALRPENIQTTIRQWLDAFGYGSTVLPPLPVNEFNIAVNMPASGVKVIVEREKSRPRYVAVSAVLIIDEPFQKLIGALSEEQKEKFLRDLRIEAMRLGADGTVVSQNQIILTRRIPVTNALTEDALIKTVNSAEAAQILLASIMFKELGK